MSRQTEPKFIEQGTDEVIGYQITCSPAAVSVAAVQVFDETTGMDVTATVMPAGSASIAGAVVHLPVLRNLQAGRIYRVEMRYSDGANVIEPYFRVICT